MNQQPSTHDLLRAFLSQPVDARFALDTGDALYRDGHEAAAVAVWSFGDDADPRMRRAKDASSVPAEVRAASARADAAFREHFTRLHSDAIDALQKDTDDNLDRVRKSIWPMTHDSEFEWQSPLQQPVIFYMPGLEAEPVTPNERLAWAPALEAVWQDVRDEYVAAVEREVAMAPYVPAGTQDPRWSKLRGTLDWSSMHLFKEGRRTPLAAQFPKTLAAIEHTDLVRVDGVPMEAFFSRLVPGAHIPPHFGLTNTRLTTHLPLIVPDDSGIRVGRDTCHWEEGTIFAFDDSFEHEAWNRADTDRVVLIFEVHHPDLSAAERAAIEHAYSARHNWLMNRRNLLERHLQA